MPAVVKPGHIGMRKPRFVVRRVPDGWGVFEIGFYNARGWCDRLRLRAMRAMGLRRYDERTGELVGKGA